MVDTIVVRSSNSIIYDPRVEKVVSSLRKKYSTLVLGWNREGLPKKKFKEYMVDLKMFNLKTSVWKASLPKIALRLIFFFPLYWMWVFIKLATYQPKVVYACDLDTAIPCYIYKILFRKRLVFDVFDRYAMGYIPPDYRMLYSAANLLEEFLSKNSDALIIAGGEKVLATFQNKPKTCVILLNCPHDYTDNENRLKVDNDSTFVVVYTGILSKNRGLEDLMEIIKELDDVKLVTAGPVIDKEIFEQIQRAPNVKYEGVLRPKDSLALELSADVLIALYDTKIIWNRLTLPNKLFEAMMCGIPIITNTAPEIVNGVQCGIIVEYGNLEQIRSAITIMRDNPDQRMTFGNNGRKAFLQKYNWSIMEQKLFHLYDYLLQK